MRKIVLVRHGRPAIDRDYPRRDQRVAGRDLPHLLAAYDASGLDPDSHPSDALRACVGDAEQVFVSDLPRARESAARLGLLERATSDAVFREAMPPAGLPASWRLPLGLWLFISRGLWLAGARLEGETRAEAVRRAGVAAARLAEAVETCSPTVLVAHGWINWLIREALMRRGWKGSGPYAREHWAHNVLTRHV